MSIQELFLLYSCGVGCGIVLTVLPWSLGRIYRVIHTILR